jgi:hypothetical protein
MPKAIDIIDGEIWKDIELIPYHQPKWPFHQVSNYGRVRVLPGGSVCNRLITEAELRKLVPVKGRYLQIDYFCKNGRYHFYAHVLVLNQFVGPCPPGKECRHLNGNPSDNRWPENQDRIHHKTDNRGERHGNAKLKESDIIDIRSRPDSNVRLAAEYNVHNTTISLIRLHKIWKNTT